MSAQIIPLRQALVRSLDMLDMGEALETAGSIMSSAGRHVMLMHEPPTDLMLTEAISAGRAIIDCATALRLARAAVELPCDTERPA